MKRAPGPRPSARKSSSAACRRGSGEGFGDFRDDRVLAAEQLELIVDWEEGGAPEGEEKDLPAQPKLPEFPLDAAKSGKEIAITDDWKAPGAFTLAGLLPKAVPDGLSFQMTAELPDGSVEPLLWLADYEAVRPPVSLPRSLTGRNSPWRPQTPPSSCCAAGENPGPRSPDH